METKKFFRKTIEFFYFSVIRKFYIFVLARPGAQKINDVILRLAILGRGYNPGFNLDVSGEVNFIRRLMLEKPTLCIDIGANRGSYTDLILQTTGADVIAFEPLPSAYRELSSLIQRFPGRLDCRPQGVGSKAGTLELNYGNPDFGLASFSKEVSQLEYVGNANRNRLEVEVTTLDSILEEVKKRYGKVDLVKIDTEGYEYQVLVGAKRFIQVLNPKYIQIEFNHHHLFVGSTLKSISDLLPNYEIFQMLPHNNGLVKRDPNTPESNIFLYSNFVFKLIEKS